MPHPLPLVMLNLLLDTLLLLLLKQERLLVLQPPLLEVPLKLQLPLKQPQQALVKLLLLNRVQKVPRAVLKAQQVPLPVTLNLLLLVQQPLLPKPVKLLAPQLQHQMLKLLPKPLKKQLKKQNRPLLILIPAQLLLQTPPRAKLRLLPPHLMPQPRPLLVCTQLQLLAVCMMQKKSVLQRIPQVKPFLA